ncbi:MAG TPA: hypothetical protein VMQ45_08340 [Burkholderiaceae bacterium]|nr:hypothetical protein [Burkholderiaceae bacterium]
MKNRLRAANRAPAWLAVAAGAVLAVTLAASDAARAQARSAAHAKANGEALVAAVQTIDPAYVDFGQGGGKGLRYLEEETPDLEAGSAEFSDIAVDQATASVTVGANFPDPELWDSFRQSVSGAAASSCFGPEALAHEQFAVEGLLRLPFLVHAAAASACD